jgi:NitT/TauT family transport system substrate-binding protein
MSVATNRGRLGAALTSSAIALCILAMGAATASAASTLRIAYDPNPTNTTIVVAQQQGFFAKNGLNVVLTTSNNTTSLTPAIGKQFDLVTTTPTTVLQAAQGGLKPILVAGETYESATLDSSYLLGGKGYTTIASLKGETVGVPSLSGVLYDAAIIVLDKAGVKPSAVHFLTVPISDMYSDLQSGVIQGAVVFYPFQGQILGAGGTNLGNPVEQSVHNIPMMDAGWIAYRPWALAHLKVLREFQKAQNEAQAWMNANITAARQILVTSFQLPSFVAATYPVATYDKFTVSNADLASWVKPMQQAGLLKKSFTVKEADSLVLKGI